MDKTKTRRILGIGLAIIYVGLIVFTIILATGFLPADRFSQRKYFMVIVLCAINIAVAIYRFLPPIGYRIQNKSVSFAEAFEVKNIYLNKRGVRYLIDGLEAFYFLQLYHQFSTLEVRENIYPGLDNSVLCCLVLLWIITGGYCIYSHRKSKG